MKYVYGILAIVLFVVGSYFYNGNAISFIFGVCFWLGSGISAGLCMRKDSFENEKRFQKDLETGL